MFRMCVPLFAVAALGVFAPVPSYRSAIERWRAAREAALRADDGWLTVAGLFWLKEGENAAGADPSAAVQLPAGSAPARIGSFILRGRAVRFQAVPRAGVRLNGKPVDAADLNTDGSGKPDVLSIGRLKLLVIERGGRYAVRLKDNGSELRKEFAGCQWFPVDESWRIRAHFVPYAEPKKMAFDTVVGVKEEMSSPGYLTFTHGGNEYRLEPAVEDDSLFIVFRDATSGRSTYGGARFLNADMPKNGSVVLDFNKAVNPPCAFTAYATCPIAPKQNRLTLAITAGERYSGPAHR